MKDLGILLLLTSIFFSCQINRKKIDDVEVSEKIRINQIGYEINAPKRFVVVDSDPEIFELINERGDVRFEGRLVDRGVWEASGESVKMGDFSEFSEPGTYRIYMENAGISFPFVIGGNIFLDAAIDGLKSFYLQRMSMDIDQDFAGVYMRRGGHPDTVCYFHESTGKSAGFKASRGDGMTQEITGSTS